MEKLTSIEFVDCRDTHPGIEGIDYCYMFISGHQNRAVRTKTPEGWPREAFYDADKDVIHIISYDSTNTAYLLESSVRLGRTMERHESKMTVAEIKVEIGNESANSMQEIVEMLSKKLAYTAEGFAPRPVVKFEHMNPTFEHDDVLATGRGARGMSEKKRAKIRTLLAQDPVDKDELPDGMLTLT